jgi:hypothetical protein
MCELASIVERSSEEIAELPDAQAEEEFTELRRGMEAYEAACLRRLPDLERRRVHERDGHLSVASWMASTHRVSYGTARRSAATARALEHMPETRRALEQGEISGVPPLSWTVGLYATTVWSWIDLLSNSAGESCPSAECRRREL